MFAVDVVGASVAYRHDFIRIAIALYCIVYFEFNSEEPASVAIEDGIGFVVIVFYSIASFETTIAIIAIGIVITAVAVVCIVCMNYPAAIYTGIVVVVIAILTERDS